MKFTKKKITILLTTLTIFLAGINYLLFGYSKNSGDVAQASALPNFTELVFQTLVLLGFIILIIYIVLFLLRKYVYKSQGGNSGNALEILNISPLIPKKSVCVVKMVDRILVLGLTESGISALTEIEDPERQDKWERALKNSASGNSSPFARQLASFLRGNKIGVKK